VGGSPRLPTSSPIARMAIPYQAHPHTPRATHGRRRHRAGATVLAVIAAPIPPPREARCAPPGSAPARYAGPRRPAGAGRTAPIPNSPRTHCSESPSRVPGLRASRPADPCPARPTSDRVIPPQGQIAPARRATSARDGRYDASVRQTLTSDRPMCNAGAAIPSWHDSTYPAGTILS
jgi:hypothetical protein